MTQNTPLEVTRLADILAAENAALAAFDLGGAAALLDAKTRAAAAFQAARATWPDPDAVSTPLLRLAEENRRLLQRAITVQGRVIELVARAIPRAMQQAAGCYGARGKVPCPHIPAMTVSARA